MMFAVAGQIIAKLTGLDLSEFLHKYLWTPMGMKETFFGQYDPIFQSSGLSIADSYIWEPSSKSFVKNTEFDRGEGDLMRGDEGAGAVISNVLDYAKYLRIMMAETGPISKAGHRELKRPRTFHNMNEDMFSPSPIFYGLAWAGSVFEGEQIYWHTGTVTSFVTFMVMVPAREYGIVVLSNADSKVRELITYRILYDLFDVDEDKRRDFEKLFVGVHISLKYFEHPADIFSQVYQRGRGRGQVAGNMQRETLSEYSNAASSSIGAAGEPRRPLPSSSL